MTNEKYAVFLDTELFTAPASPKKIELQLKKLVKTVT